MTLMSPDFLWLLILVPGIWMMTGRSQVFGHSQASLHKKRRLSSIVGILTKTSKVTIWAILVLALSQVMMSGIGTKTEPGGVVLFEQDVSGSIKTGVADKQEVDLAGPGFDKPAPSPYDDPRTSGGSFAGQNGSSMPYIMDQKPTKSPERIDAALGAIRVFIAHSHDLRVALAAFDDKMYYYYPPTRDHKVIVDLLPDIKTYVETKAGGTNFDGPYGESEQDDGALQGAVNVLSQVPDSQARIFIMVTDGDSSIDAGRAQQLIAQYKKLHIHMFVFGIGPDWASNSSSVQPLTNFVKEVGGEIAPLQDTAKFQAALSHIDTLARSTSRVYRENDKQDAFLELMKLLAIVGVIYLALSALSSEQL